MEEKDDYPITQATPLSRRHRITSSRPWKFYQRHRLIVLGIIMLILLLPLLGLLALRNRHSARAEWISPAVQPSRDYTPPQSV